MDQRTQLDAFLQQGKACGIHRSLAMHGGGEHQRRIDRRGHHRLCQDRAGPLRERPGGAPGRLRLQQRDHRHRRRSAGPGEQTVPPLLGIDEHDVRGRAPDVERLPLHAHRQPEQAELADRAVDALIRPVQDRRAPSDEIGKPAHDTILRLVRPPGARVAVR